MVNADAGNVMHRCNGRRCHSGWNSFISPDRKSVASITDGATVEFWDSATGRRLATWLPFADDQELAVSPEGHYYGSPRVERLLVYVVQTDEGQQTLTPEEFAAKYGWKNDPQRVKLPGTP